MLRHYGSRRTYRHNIYLASTLSLVAGIVNITGWMALGVLTTNITGHFVFLSEEVLHKNSPVILSFIFFLFSFLLGAFVSSFCLEAGRYKTKRHLVSYILPISLEIVVLLFVALSDRFFESIEAYSSLLAMLLLFAMGMQNALVTQVSRAVVRTTHLTGIFTDFGIELSQLIFFNKSEERRELKHSLFLKFMIIGGFASGGILGGILYSTYQLKTLLLTVFILVAILIFDNMYVRRYLREMRRIGTANIREILNPK